MSLTCDDLQAIRKIVEETVNPIRSDLEAHRNDIKDIYGMIAELIEAAKQAGVTLPSQ